MDFDRRLDLYGLHNVCFDGDIDQVKKFLNSGVDPTKFTEFKETALHVACRSRNCNLQVLECMVHHMLENAIISSSPFGLDHYRDEEGRTPLHTALYNDKREFALYLITKCHCSAFTADINQKTPLYLACQRKDGVVVVQECCSQVHEGLDQGQCHELVKCMEAVHNKDTEILPILCQCIEFEQLFTALIETRNDTLTYYLVRDLPKLKDCEEKNACKFACEMGYNKIARYLLESLTEDIILLKYFFFIVCRQGHLDLVKYLIDERGIDPTTYCVTNLKFFPLLIHQYSFTLKKIGRVYWSKALHVSCYGGHLDVVRFLVVTKMCGLDCVTMSLSNDYVANQMPIHLAAKQGHNEVVQFLLGQKCHPLPLDSQNNTPLHVASRHGHAEVVSSLLGYVPHEGHTLRNERQSTPLHEACTRGSLKVLSILLESNLFDYDAQDQDGNTPLHIACMRGKEDYVEILYKNTDCSLKNKEGLTAMDAAEKKGHLRPLSVAYFRACISEGVERMSINNVKFVLTGPPRAGKTTLRHQLLGIPLDPSCSPSTGIAETENVAIVSEVSSMRPVKGAVASEKKWAPLTVDSEAAVFLDRVAFGKNIDLEGMDSSEDEDENSSLTSSSDGNLQPSFMEVQSHSRTDETLHSTMVLPMIDNTSSGCFSADSQGSIPSRTDAVSLHSTTVLPMSSSVSSRCFSADSPGSVSSNKSVKDLCSSSNITASMGKSIQCLSDPVDMPIKELGCDVTVDDQQPKSPRKCSVLQIKRILAKSQSEETSKLIQEVALVDKESAMLQIIDTGGQPEFHEILPALITGPCVNVIVFNLKKNFKEPYNIEYTFHNEKGILANSPLYKTSLTHEDMIFRSLASIASLRHSRIGWNDEPTTVDESETTAFLIGSHRDLVSEQTVRCTNEHLKMKVEGSTHLFGENIVQYQSSGEVIFALDTRKDLSKIAELRETMNHVLQTKFKKKLIPVSWQAFSIGLRSRKAPVLSYKECSSLAKDYGIDEKDIKEVLWFLHHRAGVLLYFPKVKGLGNIVIVNLLYLFERITAIIANYFIFDTLKNRSAEQSFYERGRFSKSDIEKLPKRKNDRLTPERLITLLRHLLIVAPIKCEAKYFMPCALKPIHVSVQEGVDSLAQFPPPLLLWFDCGYCPVGVFCSLVVFLLSQNTHKCTWKLTDELQHRNKIRFTVFDEEQRKHFHVTLIERSTYFEILSDDRDMRDCSFIRCTVNQGIQEIKETLGYQVNSSHKFGFHCRSPLCPPDSPHPAVNQSREDGTINQLKCVLSGRESIRAITPEELVWYDKIISAGTSSTYSTLSNKRSPSAKCLDVLCTEIYLAKLAQFIPDWEIIAFDFGITSQQVEAIKRDYPQQYELQKRKMLLIWKEKVGKAATRRNLIQIFKKLGNQAMVDRIKDDVLKEQGPSTIDDEEDSDSVDFPLSTVDDEEDSDSVDFPEVPMATEEKMLLKKRSKSSCKKPNKKRRGGVIEN